MINEKRKEYWKINDDVIDQKPAHLPAEIFTRLPNLKYWSKDALVKVIKGAFAEEKKMLTLERRCGGIKKGVQTRELKRIALQLVFLPEDHDKIIKLIYEIILRADNMGTLHGFGVANKFGDPLVGNPEIQSLSDPIPPPKERKGKMAKGKDGKKKEKGIDVTVLQTVAKDLQKVLGLGDQIDPKKKDVKYLQDKIKEAAEVIDVETDEEVLKDNTIAYLKENDLWPDSDVDDEAEEDEESDDDEEEIEED